MGIVEMTEKSSNDSFLRDSSSSDDFASGTNVVDSCVEVAGVKLTDQKFSNDFFQKETSSSDDKAKDTIVVKKCVEMTEDEPTNKLQFEKSASLDQPAVKSEDHGEMTESPQNLTSQNSNNSQLGKSHYEDISPVSSKTVCFTQQMSEDPVDDPETEADIHVSQASLPNGHGLEPDVELIGHSNDPNYHPTVNKANESRTNNFATGDSNSVPKKRACSDTELVEDEPEFKVPKIELGDDSEDGFQNNIINQCYYNFNLASTRRSYNNLEFDVLDEVDETTNGDLSNNECSDSDISEDEIDALLDEGLTRPPKENDELAHEERKKVLLKIRGHNHFDVLPEGWIEVTHNSGMPVYLHKQSRVCTMSKPYFLGSGSARKHGVPISAIPCLHYKKEIEKEKFASDPANADTSVPDKPSAPESIATSGPSLPPAKVESVQESQKDHSVDYMGVREYCQKLFDFQTITVRRFRTWAGRRKHQKILKEQQRPSLPEGTKLITCPLPPVPEKAKVGNGNVNIKREFIMNPSGKSFVCILHEYVQHAMRMQPKYIFKELENASTPYGAIVVINNMEYGSGYGSSKKQAKSEAARATLEILIPQLKEVGGDGKATAQDQQQDVAFFDEVRIEDSRVNELCVKAGQPSPYQILLECLKRNYGMGDTQIQFKMQNLKHQKNMFTMTVGKHEASVLCKNKRDGKQRASQAILQALHPHITSWGSLLRLYGKGSCKTLKEKKEEEQRITELQSKACANRPNLSILNKLKEEMLKLKVKQDAVKPIGKFIPEELELPSTSASNLKNVEL